MFEGSRIVHIIQGEHRVSDAPDVVISTILGSCVAACLFDSARGIGGMNHFLLPGNDPNSGDNVKYGAHSMEQLINALLRQGALKHRLKASLFGGANMIEGLTKIGSANAEFARQFIATEGIPLVDQCLGGSKGRKLRFHPPSGKAQMQFMAAISPLTPRPAKTVRVTGHAAAGEVSLF